METHIRKLNLGCGTDIRHGEGNVAWVNLDSAALEGVDIVCDLTQFPWNIPDNSFDEIIAYDILEHLPNTVKTMEEIWRILKPDGEVEFRIPYWNSTNAITDPTHVRFFNQDTLEFWNIDSAYFKSRSYYSTARFRRKWKIIDSGIWRFAGMIKEGLLQKIMLKISNKIGNVTRNLYVRLIAVK